MNAVTTHSPPPLPTEELMARPLRGQLWRSRAGELVTNAAKPEEIAEAITDAARADIAAARAGIDYELVTAAAHQSYEEALTAELGKYLALTAGGWSVEDKAEWLNAATDELMEFPLSLLLPELRLARRREPWPNKLVPAIVEKIEARVQRLHVEDENLRRLEEVARAA